MMERIVLGLLIASGWQSSSCLPRRYVYVADPKTWTEAQTYCREKYTDLATVENSNAVDHFISAVSHLHQGAYVWIGLFSKIEWKWSDGYSGSGADFRFWQSIIDNEPDFYAGSQFCVMVAATDRWWDESCTKKINFMCYKGTQQDPEYVYVNEKLDWSDARTYCRENFIDLATIRNETENQEIHSLRPSVSKAWIGLYRDPDVHWSDGTASTFTYWGSSNTIGTMRVVCGVANMQSSGKWRPLSCDGEYPFVCAERAKQKKVMKLRVKPVDFSVDLNDPSVKADLLTKLYDRLTESGSSGVTLKWRLQPEGKVFHREVEGSPMETHPKDQAPTT